MEYDGKLRLLEIAQVPKEYVSYYFNCTNATGTYIIKTKWKSEFVSFASSVQAYLCMYLLQVHVVAQDGVYTVQCLIFIHAVFLYNT